MQHRPWFDAGHGGHDPGAVGLVHEEDVALAIVKKCMAAAERQGWKPGASRTKDVFIPLADRCRKANDAKADAFVSIHLDWSGAKGKGFAVIEPKNATATTGRLSDTIFANLDPLTAYKDIGVYADRRGLAVLRGTRMPATLVEVLSVSDKQVKDPAFQDDVAEGIIRGLCAWYGTRYIPPTGKAKTSPPVKPLPKPAPRPKQTHPKWPGRFLKEGMRGDDVMRFQDRLAQRGWNIKADGIFGPKTKMVVRAFQIDKDLLVDGIVGPATWDALWTAPVTK